MMRDLGVKPDILIGARAMQDWGVKVDPWEKKAVWPRSKPSALAPLLER